MDPFSRYAGFVTNRRLLLSGSGMCSEREVITWDSPFSDAMGRVLYSWKDLQDLAGYTARVSELIDTMSDIRTGSFKKSLIASASEEENAKCRFARPRSKTISLTRSSQCYRAVARSLSQKRLSLKVSPS